MNAEYLLDTMGLLDDDLIQEAETYTVPRRARFNAQRWLSLAASFAVVIALGYGAVWMLLPRGGGAGSGCASGGGTGNQAAGSTGGGAEILLPGETFGDSSLDPVPESPDAPNSGDQAGEGDYCAAIMVDGTLYWFTGQSVPAEVDESIIRTVTSYTDTQPEEDGQTNFDRTLTVQYAMTGDGLLVRIDGAWILFDPVPPWER